MIDRVHAGTVAVIGAGPVGLAAAAQLLERGFAPLVLEAGRSIAAHLESYRHVQLFSPWRHDIDPAARRLLLAHGWPEPDADALPTAGDMIDRYLEPLARVPAIASALRLAHRVTGVTRDGIDKMKSAGRENAPFVLRVATPAGPREFSAWAVVDASGTWSTPNPLGANGLPAIGERQAAGRITYGMPDIAGRERGRFAGKHVLVVGAGHSAAGGLLALAALAESAPGTRLAWAVRGRQLDRVFGGGEADQLPARGALGSRLKALVDSGRLTLHSDFRIREIDMRGTTLTVRGTDAAGEARAIEGIDEIVAATGSRPDLSLAAELRVKLDPWIESTEALAPLIDPNVHSCGTVPPHGHRELAHPEPRYYAVGAKSYGRAPNFLMATGYEQVRSVAAALAGDAKAADEVQLVLPKTGVCSAPARKSIGIPVVGAASACCG